MLIWIVNWFFAKTSLYSFRRLQKIAGPYTWLCILSNLCPVLNYYYCFFPRKTPSTFENVSLKEPCVSLGSHTGMMTLYYLGPSLRSLLQNSTKIEYKSLYIYFTQQVAISQIHSLFLLVIYSHGFVSYNGCYEKYTL